MQLESPPRTSSRQSPVVSLPAHDLSLLQDADQLSQALEELARIYQLQDPRQTCAYGITLTECYALEALVLRGPLTVNEIAAFLSVDKSTASRAAAGLVRKRHAHRRAHPQDGRSLHITATESGVRLFARIRSTGRLVSRQILTDFPPEVRQSATEILRRVAVAERACAAAGAPCG